MNKCFTKAEIYLPNKSVDITKWPVVACDQFTSEPSYWEDVNNIVGDGVSTLHMIFPEVYLDEGEARIKSINENMDKYLSDGIIVNSVNGFVLVERIVGGQTRVGLVGTLDLDKYDFDPQKNAMIRATEDTVKDRIPPRVKIRKDATLELPHVMLLADDKEQKIIEKLYARKDELECVYDIELMKEGGVLRGYAVEGELADEIEEKYYEMQQSCNGILFAVGDGNHSLATAKTCWENIKADLSDDEKENHPARKALVELVNLHSDAICFEPIHRFVLNVKMNELLDKFKTGLINNGMDCKEGTQVVFISGDERIGIDIVNSNDRLPVDVLQEWLDAYLKEDQDAAVDYIHGEKNLCDIISEKGGCGILLESIDKSTLFPAIKAGGVLPRKTFSIGEANEKRYYMECRKIK